jgi:Na+-driven multidrug efflux pump
MTASVTAFSIIQGAASALDTLLPSAWTSDHPELVGIWSQRMAVVMSILMLPILALWSQSERILLSLRQDPEVAYLASTYLIYLSFGIAHILPSLVTAEAQSQVYPLTLLMRFVDVTSMPKIFSTSQPR